MVYSEQNKMFIADKNQFFAQFLKPVEQTDYKKKDIDEQDFIQTDNLVVNHNYQFLLENQITLEAEFSQLFAVLQKQKDENNEAFWMYCYYCASLLESFYKAYSHKAKESEYSQFKAQIKDRLLKKASSPQDETGFIKSLHDSFTGSLRNLITAPFHSSQLRDYVAYSNICRLYWVFCRLTLVNGLKYAKALQFIEQLDAILGTHTDVDKIISVFEAPNGILNYLSIGFFLGRLMIDAGTLIRHTCFPTPEERQSNVSAYDRFKYELYKRHWNFGNDATWAVVNFLTNFNHISHIPDPIAGAITAVFLGFDVCMTLYRMHLFRQEYLVKKAQYLEEQAVYEDLNKHQGLSVEEQKQVIMLTKQLHELDIDWQTKQAKFYFAASAASILMLGFSATLIFSPPGIIIASYFACSVAISMYLSTGNYAKYHEKSLRLEHAELTDTDLVLAHKEYAVARDDFFFIMAKNVIVPSVLITTFAIYWPAAVALTAVYLGYELMHSQDQHSRNQEIQQLSASRSPAM